MSIPGTAGEAAESTFRWKRTTFENSNGDFVENCSAGFTFERKHFLRDVLSQCGAHVDHRLTNQGGENCKSGSMRLAKASSLLGSRITKVRCSAQDFVKLNEHRRPRTNKSGLRGCRFLFQI